jgi:hypothetical protein
MTMGKPRVLGLPSKPVNNNGYKPNPFGKRRKKK